MLRLLSQMIRAMNPRKAGSADEQGSIIIIVVVIVTLSIGLVTLFATVQSSLRASQTDQDRTAAFQRANGGIDHALFRFDRSGGVAGTSVALPATASGNYVPTLNGIGELQTFTDSVSVDGGTYTITAEADPPACSGSLTPPACFPGGQTAQYTVRSVGVDASGRQRQAVATIAAEPLFRDGFFTLLDFTLTGNQTTPIAYRSAVDPNPAVSGFFGPFPPPIDGSIGTNGTFSGAQATIRTFAERWESFNMYGRATQEAADEACADGECSDEGGTVFPYTDQKTIEMPAIPTGANIQACPNGGIFTGAITPGNYTCPTASFVGTVTIGTGGNGTGRVRIWPTSRLRFASGSVVNQLAVPAKLQIFYPEPADQASNDSTICNAEVWALLYTPGLNIACTGSHQPEIFGAVVARLHGGTGNQFQFHWDISSLLSVHNGKYRVLDWRECPVGQVC